MPILNELAMLVKRQRADMGLTQERLAELADLSRVTINQLETGKIVSLSLSNAERLANVLGYGLGVVGVRKASDDLSKALDTAANTARRPRPLTRHAAATSSTTPTPSRMRCARRAA